MSALSILLLALAAASAVFAALYFLAKQVNNFGIVDIVWAAGFAPLAVAYAAIANGSGSRRVALVIMAGGWSLRLGVHLARRVLGQHPAEDGRYQQLRRDLGEQLGVKMFLFFQGQAFLLVLLSVPFLLIARHANPAWHAPEILGAALWLLALTGETIADVQLARFRVRPENRGRVCDEGLWRYSRHPNYFFEWLVWVGFALCAWPAPAGWVAVFAPALMLFLLLALTGIRSTEDQLLSSKGDAYRQYQHRTSAFVPWFPRTDEPQAR